MSDPNFKTYRVPREFYDDHVRRDCGQSGVLVGALRSTVIIDLDITAYVDLLSDADFYVDMGVKEFGSDYASLVASARSTLKILREDGPPKGLLPLNQLVTRTKTELDKPETALLIMQLVLALSKSDAITLTVRTEGVAGAKSRVLIGVAPEALGVEGKITEQTIFGCDAELAHKTFIDAVAGQEPDCI